MKQKNDSKKEKTAKAITPAITQNALLAALHKISRAHDADVQAYGALVQVVKKAYDKCQTAEQYAMVGKLLVKWGKSGKYAGYAMQSLRNAVTEAKPKRFRQSAKANKKVNEEIVTFASEILKACRGNKQKALDKAKAEENKYRSARRYIASLIK